MARSGGLNGRRISWNASEDGFGRAGRAAKARAAILFQLGLGTQKTAAAYAKGREAIDTADGRALVSRALAYYRLAAWLGGIDRPPMISQPRSCGSILTIVSPSSVTRYKKFPDL